MHSECRVSTAEVMQQLLYLQMWPRQTLLSKGFERLAFFLVACILSQFFPFALLVEHRKYFIMQYYHVSHGPAHLWAFRTKSGQLICFRCILLAACHSISNLSLKQQQLHSVCQLIGRRMKAISQALICPWDWAAGYIFFQAMWLRPHLLKPYWWVWNLLGKSARSNWWPNQEKGERSLKNLLQ